MYGLYGLDRRNYSLPLADEVVKLGLGTPAVVLATTQIGRRINRPSRTLGD